MTDKILGTCDMTIAHGQGVHEQVNNAPGIRREHNCENFKVVPSDIIWACTERFRDIIRACYDVHSETGRWEDIVEVVKREKSKLDNAEIEIQSLKDTLQEEILNNS